MIDILIADDHQLIREGLRRILKGEADMRVQSEARNADEVFAQLSQHQPSIVLLDISMPGRSGLEILTELKRRFPNVPVLMLSMHPEYRFAVRALKAGAAGYVAKDSAADALVEAIRKVIAGGKYVSGRVAEQLADELEQNEQPLHETLSEREFQIMRMIAAGVKTGAIAEQLTLSISTVNTYRMRILSKMKMQTNAELTRYAIENHLID